MANETGKTRGESLTVMTELVIPNDTNMLGNLLGGRLLYLIDIVGAMTATRHAESIVATVQMNTVEFKRPIKLGCIVELTSYVVWTGNTSIEVAVEIYGEDPITKTREFISKVFMVFVALDAEGRKHKTIPYLPETEREIQDYEEATNRRRQTI